MEGIRNLCRRPYDLICRFRFELGQTTAEYALVLLAAAAVAVLLIKWATDSDALTSFFDAVVARLTSGAQSAGNL